MLHHLFSSSKIICILWDFVLILKTSDCSTQPACPLIHTRCANNVGHHFIQWCQHRTWKELSFLRTFVFVLNSQFIKPDLLYMGIIVMHALNFVYELYMWFCWSFQAHLTHRGSIPTHSHAQPYPQTPKKEKSDNCCNSRDGKSPMKRAPMQNHKFTSHDLI